MPQRQALPVMGQCAYCSPVRYHRERAEIRRHVKALRIHAKNGAMCRIAAGALLESVQAVVPEHRAKAIRLVGAAGAVAQLMRSINTHIDSANVVLPSIHLLSSLVEDGKTAAPRLAGNPQPRRRTNGTLANTTDCASTAQVFIWTLPHFLDAPGGGAALRRGCAAHGTLHRQSAISQQSRS